MRLNEQLKFLRSNSVIFLLLPEGKREISVKTSLKIRTYSVTLYKVSLLNRTHAWFRMLNMHNI